MEALIAGITKSKVSSLHDICISTVDLLFLSECRIITKVGGVGSAYACIEWPRVQIPQALSAIMGDKCIHTASLNEEGDFDQTYIHFYARNLAGRGLDFDENLEHKEHSLSYTMHLTCINSTKDIIHMPLPPLEDLAMRGVAIQLEAVVTRGTRHRKELEGGALRAAKIQIDWFPDNIAN
jgi:hypothetical protein